MKATQPSLQDAPPVAVATHGRRMEESLVLDAREADAYDRLVRQNAWIMNRPFIRMVSRRNRDLKRARVLDVGSGPGLIPVELAGRHPGWEIRAVDASEAMVARARRHAAEAGVDDRVHFHHGNAQELPFPDGAFDLVISHYVLHHIRDVVPFFNELRRVMGADGRLLIKDVARHRRVLSALMLGFSKYVMRTSAFQRQLYRESMQAALSLAEVREALGRSRLRDARVRRVHGVDYAIWAKPRRRG